jgi:hypothetical protein
MGGALHIAGALLEFAVLIATLRGRSEAGMPARLATLAFTWFLATAAAGVAVAHQSIAPGIHGIIGLAGFFGTLISAVTFRLLRMFERVNVEGRAPLRAIAVTFAAILTAAVARAGSIVLCIVAGLLLADLLNIARRRNPAYQRETLLYAFISLLGALFAAVAAAYGMWLQAIVLAVWFFIGLAVAGHLQRIVPFIWWIRRSHVEGARNIPTLAQVTRADLGYAVLTLWSAAGVWWLLHPFARPAAIIALAAWLLLLLQLSRVFTAKANA